MHDASMCRQVFKRIKEDENAEVTFSEITSIINTTLLANEMFIKRHKIFITKKEYQSILLDEYLPHLLRRIKFYQQYHVLSLDYEHEQVDMIIDLILIHYALTLPYNYLSDSLSYIFKNTVEENEKFFKYHYKLLCLSIWLELHPQLSAFLTAVILSLIIFM